MKKLLIVLTLFVSMFAASSQAAVVTILPASQSASSIACLKGAGMNTLRSIFDKCMDENTDVGDFSQKEYSFMIDFCDQTVDFYLENRDMMELNQDYDGIEELDDQLEVAVFFLSVLADANEVDALNSANQERLYKFADKMEQLGF